LSGYPNKTSFAPATIGYLYCYKPVRVFDFQKKAKNDQFYEKMATLPPFSGQKQVKIQ